MGTLLGLKYFPETYMDPLGLGSRSTGHLGQELIRKLKGVAVLHAIDAPHRQVRQRRGL